MDVEVHTKTDVWVHINMGVELRVDMDMKVHLATEVWKHADGI